MEVKELRIGNLIFNHKQEIIVVNGLGIDGYILLDRQHNISDIMCNPIPLTEEWLINFGFKEVLGKFVIKATDGYNVCVGLRNEKWYLYNDDCDAECNIICEVESVHRLQNLFFDIWNIELKSKG